MEYKKEKMHPFFKLMIILFLIFIAFYISLQSGYYPSRVQKRTLLTQESVNRFNSDIKSNQEIIAGSYINDDIDYSNFVTKAGNGLTYSLGKIIEKSIKGVKGTIKILFW